MQLKIAQAQYILGFLSDDELPSMATKLLIDGHDSQELRLLAGLQPSEIS